MGVTASQIRRSFDLGIGYLLRQQRAEGTFNYEYNWQEKTYSAEDSQVRQAGTLWGLCLAYQHTGDPGILAACIRGLDYFEKHSALTSGGGRFARYSGAEFGSMGTVALLALALIELLRSPGGAEQMPRDRLRTQLDQYIRFLLDSRNRRGLWHSKYDLVDGRAYGAPSAFYDGETLLALTKAAKYLDYDDLRDDVLTAAATGYRHNVLLALRKGRKRGSIAHGFYQWGLMSFCEIIDSGWPGAAQYVDPVFYLGDMKLVTRASKNNPGAVLEGLMHAYGVAARMDAQRAENYRARIMCDLDRMLSLQVSSTTAVGFMSGSASDDAAVGGFQHYPDKPTLRIDFTQHALHALLLGIRHPGLVE